MYSFVKFFGIKPSIRREISIFVHVLLFGIICFSRVGHLFRVSKRPWQTAYLCLLASGEYAEACSTIAYRGKGYWKLRRGGSFKPLERNNMPIALRASDWANLPPIALLPKPQFASLHTLLSALLGTRLQQPFSAFSLDFSGLDHLSLRSPR